MFLRPIAPPYDPLVWERLPFPEKARLVCSSWALQGYGTPLAVYLVYLLKLVGYVGGWVWFCGFTPGMGGLAEIGIWNVALGDDEILELSLGVPPSKIRPGSLVAYLPLVRDLIDVKGNAFAITGSLSVGDHCRIFGGEA